MYAVIAVALGIAASCLLSAYRLAHVVPADALDEAAVAVRDRFRAGDVILVEPWHQVGPRLRLGDLPLLEPQRLHPDDLLCYDRAHLLELDVIGARRSTRAVLASLGRLGPAQHWPGITLFTVTLVGRARARFDLRRDIAQVSVVARYPDGTTEPCDRLDRDRWVCPRNSDWSYVGPEIREIGGEPRRCVWLHPLHRGGLLRVSLPLEAAATAPGATLRGGYGFTDHAARAARAPVRLRITAGEQVLLDTRHPVTPGWQRYRLELTPGHGPIRVSVESQNNGVAHFCFAASLLERVP